MVIRLFYMKTYKPEEVSNLLSQAVKLHIPLYRELTIGEIETLVKHKMLQAYSEPITQLTLLY